MRVILLKIFQGLILIVLTGLLSAAALVGTASFKWSQELPDLEVLDRLQYTSTSQIFAANGDLIGEILPIESEGNATANRIPVTLDEVSPAALSAIIASEDDQFFNHYGFDIPAIIKAAYLLVTGEGGRGGSTITTQVIKNTVLQDLRDQDRREGETIERKIKEIMLAVELERRLTKPEILQRYINVVYWGGNLYGIRAAAQAYFDKDPIELNLAEGLYLARLIPTPGNYNDFEGTRAAMKNVLRNMAEQGVVSEETANAAWRYPLEPRGWDVTYDLQGELVGEPQRTGETLELATTVSSNLAPHVTWFARNELEKRFGKSRLYGQGGLRVYTTIEPEIQEAANEASRRADIPSGAQTAIVGLDPKTGEILAMVGERITEGKAVEEFNRAAAALRQPGSSFKPIVYATAVEQGGYTQAHVLTDEPTVFPQPGLPNWEPGNHDNRFEGPLTLRQHLNISRNIPVAKLVEALTPEVIAARARELGYEHVKPTLSIGLGSYEVTPLAHTSGIGAFANNGIHVEPHMIKRVLDTNGNVLYEAEPKRTRVWSPETAYVVLDMMHGNVIDLQSGITSFSSRADIDGRYVAGKTGTTNNEKDIWFVGMTPGLVAGVWIGFDDYSSIPKRMVNAAGETERVTSSRQPIYIWRDFVTEAIRGRDLPTDYEVPENITFARFDRTTGAPSNSGPPGAFVKGTTPSGVSAAATREIVVMLPIDSSTNKRATAATPPDRIQWRNIKASELNAYY